MHLTCMRKYVCEMTLIKDHLRRPLFVPQAEISEAANHIIGQSRKIFLQVVK